MLRDELILQPVVDEVFGCYTRVDEALDLPDEIAFVEALTEAGGDACPALLTGKGDAEDEALYGLVLGVISSCEALPLDIAISIARIARWGESRSVSLCRGP